jgi:hypothetical protein
VIASVLTLLAAVTLAPDQPGGLALNNVRGTHGLQGPARTEKKVLPGDSVFVCFDIEGITVGADGKVQYSIATEVTDAKGKTVFKQEPRNVEVPVSLGGNRVPGYSQIDCGLEQPAGTYTLKLTVVDRAANKTATFTHGFEIAERGFGLVRFAATRDKEGLVPVNVPGTGEMVWLQFGVVGFERDKASKQPNVAVELQVLDDAGKPVCKPQAGVINKDVPDNVAALPLQFWLSLNRPGKFTLAVTATDQLTKKTTKTTLPFTVVEPK